MPITYNVPKASDVNSENWACRDHPRNLRFTPAYQPGFEPQDGLQHVRPTKYRQVDPTKAMHAGGTMVKNRSKKGKFLHHTLINANGDVDARLDAPPVPKYAQPAPMIVAPKHDGNPPVKATKKIRLGTHTTGNVQATGRTASIRARMGK